MTLADMNRVVLLLLVGACTSLGPMPATTGLSAVPVGRPGLEAQVGVAAGFDASQSAQNAAKSTTINYASALVDFDRWLPFKGLIAGGRLFGREGDTPLEPYIGYRRQVVEAISVGVIGFGSTKRVTKEGQGVTYASYHGVRVGGEALVDVELYRVSALLRLHAQGALNITRILASGRYCIDAGGVGIDCSQDQPNTFVNGKFVGVYPAGTATFVLDLGRQGDTFRGARIGISGTAGRMPLVLAGEENGQGTYYSIGLYFALAFGLGAPEQAAAN
jgi:hypothetical protein